MKLSSSSVFSPKSAQTYHIPSLVQLGAELSWIVIGQITSALGVIVGVKLLTQMMLPGEYGALTLGMTIAALGQQVVTGPLGNASMRFFAPARQAESTRAYFYAAAKLTIRMSLVLALVFAAATLVLTHSSYSHWGPIVATAGAFTLISGVIGVFDSMQTAARQRATVAWHQAVFVWLRSLVAIFLMSVLGSTAATALLGYVIAAAIVSISEYTFFRIQISPYGQRESVPTCAECAEQMIKMRNYSAPFSKWGFFTWAQSVSDRWSLGFSADQQAVGLYTPISQLGYYPMSLMSSMVSQLISPIVFGEADGVKQNARRLIYYAVAFFVTLTIVLFIISYLWSDYIFANLVPPPYRSVAGLLPWMVLAGGIFSAGQLLSLTLLSEKDSAELVRPKITTSVLGVMLNLFGAQMYGVAGVVVANITLSVVFFTWIFLLTVQLHTTEGRI